MKAAASIPGRVRRQDGQVLVLVAGFLVVLIGCAALVFDVGRVYVAQQQLNAAVNSAALAAGQNLPNATGAYSAAVSYSGAPGAKNAFGGSGVTAASPNVTFECASHAPNYTSGTCPADTSNVSCRPTGAQAPTPSGATTCNAIKVSETATVQNTFGSLFFPSFTISASTTAAARGGSVHPLNVEVILDTTGSMTQVCSGAVTGIPSTSQTPEKIDCAKAGVRAFLQALWPCTSSLASCGTATPNSGGQQGANVTAPVTPVDEVGLMVFPPLSGNPPSNTNEIDCNSNTSLNTAPYPAYTRYTYPSAIPLGDVQPGYQAVGLSSDYRPSVANLTLNWGTSATPATPATSNLVQAVDWGQCSGSRYPSGDYYGLKDIGGQGSALAGAITEAQQLLNVNPRPGVTNAIVVLSDGQLSSQTNPCADAISAAKAAKDAGTVVYSIAYGANGTRCSDATSPPTDLQTMTAIASNSGTFFNAPPAGALTAAFQQVATDLTDSRLIPDCTQAPPAC
jgi:Putative Flp pilus-assembly TadE/G-like/von Willebrand factor type A domain